jgi:hypothetical protein
MWFTCLLVFLQAMLKLVETPMCICQKKTLTIITKPYWNVICLPFSFLPRSFPCKHALCFSLTFSQYILHKEALFHSPLFKAYLLHKIQKQWKMQKNLGPIWSQVKEWFWIASIFFAIGKICLSCLFVVIVSFAQTQDQNPSFWKLCG